MQFQTKPVSRCSFGKKFHRVTVACAAFRTKYPGKEYTGGFSSDAAQAVKDTLKWHVTSVCTYTDYLYASSLMYFLSCIVFLVCFRIHFRRFACVSIYPSIPFPFCSSLFLLLPSASLARLVLAGRRMFFSFFPGNGFQFSLHLLTKWLNYRRARDWWRWYRQGPWDFAVTRGNSI